MKREPRVGAKEEGKGGEGEVRRIKVSSVRVSTPHDKDKHYGLQTSTNKNKQTK